MRRTGNRSFESLTASEGIPHSGIACAIRFSPGRGDILVPQRPERRPARLLCTVPCLSGPAVSIRIVGAAIAATGGANDDEKLDAGGCAGSGGVFRVQPAFGGRGGADRQGRRGVALYRRGRRTRPAGGS